MFSCLSVASPVHYLYTLYDNKYIYDQNIKSTEMIVYGRMDGWMQAPKIVKKQQVWNLHLSISQVIKLWAWTPVQISSCRPPMRDFLVEFPENPEFFFFWQQA